MKNRESKIFKSKDLILGEKVESVVVEKEEDEYVNQESLVHERELSDVTVSDEGKIINSKQIKQLEYGNSNVFDTPGKITSEKISAIKKLINDDSESYDYSNTKPLDCSLSNKIGDIISDFKKQINEIISSNDLSNFESFINDIKGIDNAKMKDSIQKEYRNSFCELKGVYLSIPSSTINETLSAEELYLNRHKKRIVIDGYDNLILDLYKKQDNCYVGDIDGDLIDLFNIDFKDIQNNFDGVNPSDYTVETLGKIISLEKNFREENQQSSEIMTDKQSIRTTDFF